MQETNRNKIKSIVNYSVVFFYIFVAVVIRNTHNHSASSIETENCPAYIISISHQVDGEETRCQGIQTPAPLVFINNDYSNYFLSYYYQISEPPRAPPV